ncbi:uncharacterized protein LOC125680677 [Ostrea edulis]|uniref:uncharacterized protein LOC125680677 n=1 Tax=Ostrea edulis TaxID=37623 RepID=UPI0020961A85|nr:uncharacterized protein LOC125680677 [Ostrea edulis]
MDRQDFTRDWYQKQNFNSPASLEMKEMRRQRAVNGRAYPPSDSGDYRRPETGDPSPDYHSAGHQIDKRYVAMPGIANARNRNSFAGVSANQRHYQDGYGNRFHENQEGYINNGFVAASSARNSGAFGNPIERQRPQSVASVPRESAYIMYDGNRYTASEYNHYSVPGEDNGRPSWVTKASPDREKEDDKKRGPVFTVSVLARIIVIFCIIWDLSMDWLFVSSADTENLSLFPSDNAMHCQNNVNVSLAFDPDWNTTITHTLCYNQVRVWIALTAFSLIGSLLSIIQIINIGCEIIKTCKPNVFQVLNGQSEVLLVLVFEELPQIGLTISLFSLCKCNIPPDSDGRITALYGLLSVISATVSMTARYATSFGGLTANGGCCNTWWRCACCKDPEYFCRIKPKEVCCTCNTPCPLCCCTLYCRSCKWSPQTWCAPLLKAFSCFCNCCGTDNEMYGIRMMNNLGLLMLWFCVSFQIAVYVITYG